MQSLNPIANDATHKALTGTGEEKDDEAFARIRAAADEQELHDLERAELAAIDPTAVALAPRRRSLLDRLLGRR